MSQKSVFNSDSALSKLFESDDSLGFEHLNESLLEASDAIKFYIRCFDIVSYLMILARGLSVSDTDLDYFKELASDFDFRLALRRMRDDVKVPCAGESIINDVLGDLQ